MTTEYREGSATHGTGGNQATIPISTNVQVGDVMFLYATVNSATLNFTSDLTGWAPVGPVLASASAKYGLWWKEAKPSDIGSSVLLATDGGVGAKTGGGIAAYSGVDGSDPIAEWASAVESASQAAHAAPAVTTEVPDLRVVSFVLGKSSSVTSWTAPAGFTSERDEWFSGGSGQAEGAVADRAAPTPGSYGGGNWVADVPSANAAIFTVALAQLTDVTTIRPVADVTTDWAATPTLGPGETYASRIADGSDSTYLTSPAGGGVFETETDVPPNPPDSITVRLRAAAGATAMSVTVKLMEGESEIASWGPETSIVTAWTTYTYDLSPEQKAAITNLADLYPLVNAAVS